jgi:hypothetical protein
LDKASESNTKVSIIDVPRRKSMTDTTQADRDLVDKLLGLQFREKQPAIAATFDQVAAESRSQAAIVMIDPTHSMVDITAPTIVEVLVRYDGKVVWINVDGIC